MMLHFPYLTLPTVALGLLLFQTVSFAQSACAPPKDTRYIFFDTDGFAVRTSPRFDDTNNIDSSIRPGEVFVSDGINRRDSVWVIQIIRPGNNDPRWVGIPASRLWEVRFVISEADFSRAMQGGSPVLDESAPSFANTRVGLLPCAAAARHEQAQAYFSRAFELLQRKDYPLAKQLFLSGLNLESDNGPANFYFAEARRLAGETSVSRQHLSDRMS
jgi:hypothetical protein